MRMVRVAGWFILPVLFVLACSGPPGERPASTGPAQPEKPAAGTEHPGRQEPAPKPPVEREKPLEARFRLYTGPLGFKFPEVMRELGSGETAVMGLEPFDLEVLLPGFTEGAVRQALKVEGATLLAEPIWLPEGGLALQLGPGQTEQTAIVRLQVEGRSPAVFTVRRTAPATVTVDQRFGHTWRPITVLDAYATPGPSAVRLNFTKPVNKQEVEQALLAAQSAPLRGLMEWTDEKTLTWQIAELPPRLDFLLGGAHDADGLPLPGGIPSLRMGDAAILVEVNLADPADAVQGTLPPDVISASMTRDGRHINLMAWTPGTTKWDWQTADVYFDREAKALKRGRVEEAQPRLPPDIENWVMSPNAGLVAGLKSRGSASQPYQADLVIMDVRGGRSQSYPGVIGRFRGPDQVDLTHHLAWSPDSLQIAALSHAGSEQFAELVIIEAATGKRTVLVPTLPVRSDGTRLTWSPDGRWLLAGNRLIDRETKAVTPLEGAPHQASGVWEPGGTRLLYSAQDWGSVFIVDSARGEVKPLGDGMMVGWSGPGKVLVIRWSGSATRYLPPGE